MLKGGGHLTPISDTRFRMTLVGSTKGTKEDKSRGRNEEHSAHNGMDIAANLRLFGIGEKRARQFGQVLERERVRKR